MWANWSTILCGGKKYERIGESCEDNYKKIRKQGRYTFLPDVEDLKKELPQNKDFADATPTSQIILFDSIMNRSNAQRIARKIFEATQEHPELLNFKYALIGISLCSNSNIADALESFDKKAPIGLSTWIPNLAAADFVKKGFPTYQAVRSETAKFHSSNEKQKLNDSPNEVLLDTNRVVALRYIFNLQKLDIQDWNMEGLQYAHSDFGGDLSQYWSYLYPRILSTSKLDKDLSGKLSDVSAAGKKKQVCEQLSKLSLQTLTEHTKKHTTEAGSCISCQIGN